MINPLVSIIIPTYNRAHLITETLDSVLSQTYQKWECIIVDDGSTDNIFEIIDLYLKKDNRFRYYARPVDRIKGASTCRNLGFEKCNGSFIQYLDSDDIMASNKIEIQMEILKNSLNNSIVTCKWGRFSDSYEKGEVFDYLPSYNSFDSVDLYLVALANSEGYFPLHSYLIKRCSIEKCGGWNEYLSINDDGEFMMRLFVNVEKVYFAKDTVVYYINKTASNLSSLIDEQKVVDLINSWRLIDSIFKIRFKTKSVYYIEKNKEILYKIIVNKFPDLIKDNKDFFKNVLESEKNKVKFKNILLKYLKKIIVEF